MKKIYLPFLFFLFILQACSWREYFVVTNQTDSDIIVEYEMDLVAGGFPIFEGHPASYKLDASNDINWNESSEPDDLDTARFLVKIVLKPKSALIIGYLSNDHYKTHDQYFINGRSFNLKKLNVQKDKSNMEISPTNFDEYFSKKNGVIALRIKK